MGPTPYNEKRCIICDKEIDINKRRDTKYCDSCRDNEDKLQTKKSKNKTKKVVKDKKVIKALIERDHLIDKAAEKIVEKLKGEERSTIDVEDVFHGPNALFNKK